MAAPTYPKCQGILTGEDFRELRALLGTRMASLRMANGSNLPVSDDVLFKATVITRLQEKLTSIIEGRS